MAEAKDVKKPLLTRIAVVVVDILWYGSLFGIIGYTIFVVATVGGFGLDENSRVVPVALNMNFSDQLESTREAATAGMSNPSTLIQYISGFAVLRIPQTVDAWGFIISEMVTILFLPIAYLLRKVVRTARDGMPFTFDNVRRVRQIGILLMLNGPINSLVQYIIARSYLEYVEIPGAVVTAWMDYAVSLNGLILGLLVLVLAQVFDMGVRLQADNDLTV